ncbi:hypothetical protein Nepgr_024445 [Nepenthes gracilis]|uniref:C2H2-type domain-containing protein n=1 Tax=Nepenthes gracilis TaxID=150966 RepID=A0AAD3XYL7_NEPGR|nr:hypothetical protein Nepgr_024445 [Nepenthes gracilis]
MRNFMPAKEEDDDSWELRAFKEGANNIAAATWPPRSYACTFCNREFRSAQALGGHMNVHRRDRARARLSRTHIEHNPTKFNPPAPPSSTLINSPNYQEYFMANNEGLTRSSPGSSSSKTKGCVSRKNRCNTEKKPVEDLDLELRLGHL